ncbi:MULTISPECIES: nitroreductase family protein [Microbacterium]|uniref:nitroreductase family protein n=1 Tax=Microbacterium TaxID=33882 RepID=UPI00214AB7A5|nr:MULTISPECIES: nitroreductase family protein [unclassified Microbacterium]MCR2813591.1 nitroreductase family protein [Microbacterium sp. zg.Y1084]MDL5486594.1 nitroreductase family protein [Microbacterium sp. zg-Y1211]
MLTTLKRIAKDLLAITWIRRVYEFGNRAVLETFGSSRALTQIWYVVSFMTFNREQSAVLRGRRDYYRNKHRDRVSHVELRRNIHRLEKGLIMRPRRDVFARDYITETIEFYEEAAAQHRARPDSMEASEIEWAHDVLAEYFRVATGPDATIAAARDRFHAATGERESTHKIPHPKEKLSDIAYEDLELLVTQRRSVRWFEQRAVPREDIDRALTVARQAPTACNRLPYEFRVFDDPAMVREVASIPFGAAGYAQNIPTIIVVVGKLESYFSPRDRHAIYVDSSLAAMQFILALETLGLSSSIINWPDFEPLEQKMQRTLDLKITDRVVMLIAVGYADTDGMVPFSQKKELDTFRRFN